VRDELVPPALDVLDAAAQAGVPTYVSPISAWEVGLLVSRNRLNLLMSPQRWFSRLFDAPDVRLADMSPDLLIAASFLPGTPPRDPADRIIAATARDLGATLITRDRALLDYGEDGHISVVAC
jgi:PIN domain nuclease of toxin-antitoxin system